MLKETFGGRMESKLDVMLLLRKRLMLQVCPTYGKTSDSGAPASRALWRLRPFLRTALPGSPEKSDKNDQRAMEGLA